jgi:hypothetical protein
MNNIYTIQRHQTKLRMLFQCLLALAATATASLPAMATEIADGALEQVEIPPPNVVFIFDNSDSMGVAQLKGIGTKTQPTGECTPKDPCRHPQ